jgi:hypothetical protein
MNPTRSIRPKRGSTAGCRVVWSRSGLPMRAAMASSSRAFGWATDPLSEAELPPLDALGNVAARTDMVVFFESKSTGGLNTDPDFTPAELARHPTKRAHAAANKAKRTHAQGEGGPHSGEKQPRFGNHSSSNSSSTLRQRQTPTAATGRCFQIARIRTCPPKKRCAGIGHRRAPTRTFASC